MRSQIASPARGIRRRSARPISVAPRSSLGRPLMSLESDVSLQHDRITRPQKRVISIPRLSRILDSEGKGDVYGGRAAHEGRCRENLRGGARHHQALETPRIVTPPPLPLSTIEGSCGTGRSGTAVEQRCERSAARSRVALVESRRERPRASRGERRGRLARWVPPREPAFWCRRGDSKPGLTATSGSLRVRPVTSVLVEASGDSASGSVWLGPAR